MRRDEFAKRRRLLMRHMGRDAIAILPAAPVRTRNNDVEYNYRPDSDFYYLTSFAEPEAVAVLIPGRPQGEFLVGQWQSGVPEIVLPKEAATSDKIIPGWQPGGAG